MVDKRYEIEEKEETWGGIAEDEVASEEEKSKTAAASQYGNGSDLSTYLVDPKRSRRRLNHVIAREIPWQCKRVSSVSRAKPLPPSPP